MADEETRGKHARPAGAEGDSGPDTDATVRIGGAAAPDALAPDDTVRLADIPNPAEGPATTAQMPVAQAAAPAIAEAGEAKAKAGKTAAKVLGALVAVALLAYGGLGLYYQSHFLPRTVIGAYDVSDLTFEEAAARFSDIADDYSLSVEGQGLDFTLTREETGLQVDSQKVVRQALNENPAWMWPYYLLARESQDLTDAMQATFDKGSFEAVVRQKVAALNKDAADPVSATIAYSADVGVFEVVPEQLGGKLDEGAVLAKVEESALRMAAEVQVGEDELLRPPLLEEDERLAAAVADANGFLGVQVDVKLGGKSFDKIDDELIASWVVLTPEVRAELSEDLLRNWTGSFSDRVNTVGKVREYTTPRGETFTVEGGIYGWTVDYEAFVEAVKQDVNTHYKGELDVPCLSTAAEPPNDKNVDWGKRYVDVNIAAQHAVFYDGDAVLWESDIISGSPDGKHDTTKGVYVLNLKESPSKLVGEMVPVTVEEKDSKGKKKTRTEMKPEYETEVQFWMPFIGNSIGFHDATWQPGFGGSMYQEGYGSHGCVNLPYDAAEQLYGILTEGTPVVVHG